MAIILKTLEEIEIMRQTGKILAKVMRDLEKEVKPGVTTKYLDKVAEDLVFKYGGKCSFKGHLDFPNCLCASVNEIIVHGIPSDKKLDDGDIISLDLGVLYRGFHSDMAVTLGVGKINPEISKLIETTKKALEIGIKEIKIGKKIGAVSSSIQKYAETRGYGVVKELCGHGIGKNLHEDPQVPNYVEKNEGAEIKEGMVICL